MVDKSPRRNRRKVLRLIASGAALGSVSGISSAQSPDNSDSNGAGYDYPDPKKPDELKKFDPNNLNEVAGVNRELIQGDVHDKISIEKQLNEKQKEALADANRIAGVTRTVGVMPETQPNSEKRNKALSEMTNAEILSVDSKMVREDIGKKWGWSK